jgi:hypothetical protein
MVRGEVRLPHQFTPHLAALEVSDESEEHIEQEGGGAQDPPSSLLATFHD